MIGVNSLFIEFVNMTYNGLAQAILEKTPDF